MKQDERELLRRVQTDHTEVIRSVFGKPYVGRKTPREIAREIGMHPKRADYLCQKWADKGWYDYGVMVDLGWLTDEGKAIDTAPESAEESDSERLQQAHSSGG